MQQTDDLNLATKIKKESDINAPINDIIECINELKSTGINSNTVENMVVKIFKSNNSRKYSNKKRFPEDDEILLYNCSDSWLDTINNPE